MTKTRTENLTVEDSILYHRWLEFADDHDECAADYRKKASEMLAKSNACCLVCDGGGWVGQRGSKINCPECRPHRESPAAEVTA